MKLVVVVDVIIEPYETFDVTVVAYEVDLSFAFLPFSGFSSVLRGENPFRYNMR